MGTARVKVTKVGTVPLLKWLAGLLRILALRGNPVLDDLLDNGLRPAVGVGGTDRAVFGDGDHVLESGSIAVDGGGRRKHDVGDIVLAHGVQKRYGASDIDAIVFKGNLGGFTDSLVPYRLDYLSEFPAMSRCNLQCVTHLKGSEVNDAVDGGMLLKYFVYCTFLGEVGLVKDRPLPSDKLNAIEGDLRGVVEVVYNDDLIAMLKQSEGSEGSNVSRTTVDMKIGS